MQKTHNKKNCRLFPSMLALVLVAACSITSVPVLAADQRVPYLLLISIDGFRHDYIDQYPTPALRRLASSGVRATSMQPVWPTLTFPNHFSIATGLYPAEHGLVGNRFPGSDGDWYDYKNRESVQDGRWYGGVPVWVAAERAGLGSAAFYFVGTEAPVQGISPGDWRPFDDDVSGEARVGQVLEWLARPDAQRPNVVTLYFEHVDVASHRYGPGSDESIAAIRQVDGWIGELMAGLDTLPIRDDVHIVIVSDHGQILTRRDEAPFVLEDVVDLDGVTLVEHGSLAMVFVNDSDPLRAKDMRDAINDAWQHGRAWLKNEAPAYWQVAGDNRVADLLIQPDPGYVVIGRRDSDVNIVAGDHGWSPGATDMHGIFIASGAKLPAGVTVPTIEAVDVYPLLLGILGLEDPRENPRRSPLMSLIE